jgi:gluconokinase
MQVNLPQKLVVMGVSGCGKTTVGKALAARLGADFHDGDDLHPVENLRKMSQGIPLTDEDRWPWLTRVGEALNGGGARVVACSALKRRYRDHIRQASDGVVTFIHLVGEQAVIAVRMQARAGHFMPPTLLYSQFAALEPPGPDEGAVTVTIDHAPEAVVDAIAARLRGQARRAKGLRQLS